MISSSELEALFTGEEFGLLLDVSGVGRFRTICLRQIHINSQERLSRGRLSENLSLFGLDNPADAGEVPSVCGCPGKV